MVYLLKYLCYGHGACLVNWIVEEKFWLIRVCAMFHLVHLCCTSCCKSHCTHSNNQSPVSLLSYDINACQISAWVSALRCQFLSLVSSFCQVSCPELCGITLKTATQILELWMIASLIYILNILNHALASFTIYGKYIFFSGMWLLSGGLARMVLVDCEQNEECCSLTISGMYILF